jgi:Rhodopirellula transposase DDE domain
MTEGEKSRASTQAADHDFKPTATVIPFGIFLPQYNQLSLALVTSKLTADCIVDRLEEWWQQVKAQFPHIRRWVINADNGPENSSRRTQFMHRLVVLAQREQITIQLAYYPPYHSKYNPVERTFGWLEQHWRGSLLNSVETVVRFAESLTFKGKHPTVNLVSQAYETGIKLTQAAMADLEKQFHRLPGLEKWFVEITPQLA